MLMVFPLECLKTKLARRFEERVEESIHSFELVKKIPALIPLRDNFMIALFSSQFGARLNRGRKA
jgi:hypothetical protein